LTETTDFPKSKNEKGSNMTKTQLLKKLDAMLTTAENERMWGNIDIELKEGIPQLLRKMTTEKLQNTMENTRGRYEDNR
jgi:hypothetical protein